MLVRLGVNDLRDPDFNCGDEDLNEFFLKDSIEASSQLVAVTYAWVVDGKTAGFLSLSNDAIKRELISKPQIRNISHGKRFATLPAVKIGRLATTAALQGSGVGTEILDYIKYWFTDNNKTGCRFIVVDAYNNDQTINFYLKNGFSFSIENDPEDKTRLMFFDLKMI